MVCPATTLWNVFLPAANEERIQCEWIVKLWLYTPFYLTTRSESDDPVYVLCLGLRGYRSRVQFDGSKEYLRTDGRQASPN
jgi:hypothetical protein